MAKSRVSKRKRRRDQHHRVKTTLSVDIWYPDHEDRAVSTLFKKTKKRLVEDLDVPCFVCGTREDREVHHFHVEWAFANAVDWEKMKLLHPTFDWGSFVDAEDFVDSEYNMIVLCETHHRHKYRGIHQLPYPIWIMQKHVADDFDIFAEDGLFNPEKK